MENTEKLKVTVSFDYLTIIEINDYDFAVEVLRLIGERRRMLPPPPPEKILVEENRKDSDSILA